MIDAGPVAEALRELSRLDDTEVDRLTAGTPLDRAALRRALVTGQLAASEFVVLLGHLRNQAGRQEVPSDARFRASRSTDPPVNPTRTRSEVRDYRRLGLTEAKARRVGAEGDRGSPWRRSVAGTVLRETIR